MRIDRREFIKTAGYLGTAFAGLAINPARTYGRPSNLRITDIRGCTIASNYDYPILRIYTNQGIDGLGEVRDMGYLREPQYLFKAGYFAPTPEFDQLISREEAMKKRIISRNGIWNGHNGPWVHLDEEGNLVDRADPR